MSVLKSVFHATADLVSFHFLLLRPRGSVAAENLLRRRKLAFCQERRNKPRRIDPASKLSLILLSKLFNWKEALVIVRLAGLSPARYQPRDG